ncbi:hypothetical protein Adt_28677 [Abeliophyllum distichum]|uniref:Uncharacterized protein n=1 Tax=Abeliophyllum distichum TaxID=126358 RepID=A0ABD1RYK4_9LAMI
MGAENNQHAKVVSMVETPPAVGASHAGGYERSLGREAFESFTNLAFFIYSLIHHLPTPEFSRSFPRDCISLSYSKLSKSLEAKSHESSGGFVKLGKHVKQYQ